MNRPLKETQKAFLSAIWGEEGAITEEIKGNVSPEGLLGIYRNNVVQAHGNALALVYPVIQKLVGEKFFNATAKEFTRKHPPQSGNLEEYGETFADFLETFPPAQQLPYLPDVARFEWLYQEVLEGEGGEMLSEASLAEIGPEDFERLTFTLHPTCRFYVSPYPIDKIWQANQEGADSEETIDLGSGGVELLLNRPEKEVHMVTLSKAERIFLKQLEEGVTFYAAYEKAAGESNDFDLAFYLKRHMVNGTFSSFTKG